MVTASTTLRWVDINSNNIDGLWLWERKRYNNGRWARRRHFDDRSGWRGEAHHRRRRLLDDGRTARRRRRTGDNWGRGGHDGGNFPADGDGTVAGWFEIETFLCAAIFALVDWAAKDVHFIIGSVYSGIAEKRVYLLLKVTKSKIDRGAVLLIWEGKKLELGLILCD